MARSLWLCKAAGPAGPCRTVLGVVRGNRLTLDAGVVAWVADLRAGRIVVGCPACGAGRAYRAGTVRRFPPGAAEPAVVTGGPVPARAAS